ncbi:MAG: PHP domain-containing protein [Desulfobacterota bacterium]|nr:PHP domain-containing protein [Thermodesulfobacteriota bacterium]
MFKVFWCDLHNHTCASPCADPELTPDVAVAVAIDRGLDVLAITDHNTAENIEAAQRAAIGTRLTVIPGIEITTQEEVHVLALFATAETAHRFVAEVYGAGQRRTHREASTRDVAGLIDVIYRYNGIAIASHIDRMLFSVLSHYGRIPDGVRFDALEVSAACTIAQCRERYPGLASATMITASDAHCIADIGRACIRIKMAAPTLEELRCAFAHTEGRAIIG